MAKLPREVLTVGSPTLEHDCAVCKDTFKLETDDPDEQIVVTLPCKHPFHEPCIIPWLKSSGTCPVCRYALIPQPNNHSTPGTSGSPPASTSSSRPAASSRPASPPSPPSPTREATGGSSHHNHGFISSLLGAFSGHGSQSSGRNSSSTSPNSPPNSPPRRSNTDPNSRPPRRNRDHLPGGWADDLD